MGQSWDSNKGGRDHWIAWLKSIMQECYRVLKPGAYAFVWSLPRTSHYTAMALEDAGFDIRNCCVHHYGTGFPKSLSIDKAIDKLAGVEREVIRTEDRRSDYDGIERRESEGRDDVMDVGTRVVTSPATADAKKWVGWGGDLKPASEFWWLCRKPLSEKTIAENVLKWGTGGLNIDASRISTTDNLNGGAYSKGKNDDGEWGTMHRYTGKDFEQPTGRFPANAVFSHSPGCQLTGTRKVKSGIAVNENRDNQKTKNVYGDFNNMQGENKGYADEDGFEEVEKWECVEGCPIKELDKQSGILKSGTGSIIKKASKGYQPNAYGKESRKPGTEMISYGDQGGASRFFKNFPPFLYQSKPSKKEKSEGCTAENKHPTPKSIFLMEYLIRMVTQPGGIVLDPFMGSGTTGVAAIKNGFDFIGIEKEEEYFKISEERINHASQSSS